MLNARRRKLILYATESFKPSYDTEILKSILLKYFENGLFRKEVVNLFEDMFGEQAADAEKSVYELLA